MTPVKNDQPPMPIPMTPNTRKQKSRQATDLTNYILDLNLSKDDQLDVLTLSLKQLGILEKIKFSNKPSKKGRSLTKFETRQNVWEFWHRNSVESTITSQLHKIPVNQKPRIQEGLQFVDTITRTKQRNRDYYQSIRRTCVPILKPLYLKYCNEIPSSVSWRTFFSLTPLGRMS